jgi:hypothetical protein
MDFGAKNAHSYKKRTRKMMMKLTPRINPIILFI